MCISKDRDNMNDNELEVFEEKWIEQSMVWLDFLRGEGLALLQLPIPAEFLVSKSHFYDFAENGELHLQSFPRKFSDFDISDMTKDQILKLYEIISYLFSDEQNFSQMYVVRLCREIFPKLNK